MTTTRYTIEVDATRANQELARAHSASTTLAGTEKALENAVKQTNTALAQQAPAAAAAGAGMVGLQKSAQRLSGVLGKQAAAIALVSQHLGEGNGKIGEAVKGAGMMAAAFGAGGPWAAALVAGIALVGQLNKHWEELNRLQIEEINKTYQAVDAQKARVTLLRQQTKEMKDQARTADELRTIERETIARDLVKAQILRDHHDRRSRIVGLSKEEVKNHKAMKSLYSDEAAALANKMSAMSEIRQKAKDEVAAAKAKALAEERATAAVERRIEAEFRALTSRHDVDNELGSITEAEDARNRVRHMLDNMALDRENWQASLTEIDEQGAFWRMQKEKDLNQIKYDNDVKMFELREQAHKDFWEDVSGYSMTATAIMASASTQLLADLIGGQEKALERFGISIMAQAGQALVSYGVQGIGSGVLQTSLGNPAGLGQIAVGTGLVAAGVGLGGVAGGLSGLMGGSTETQRPLPGAMASPIGQQGGGTSFTIVYGGLSGPTAEQGAEALVGGQRLAERRNHSGGRDSR